MFDICNSLRINMNRYNKNYGNCNNKISSGKKINYAKDSPSEILKINRMESIIRKKQAVNNNIQSAISYIDLKETTLNTINEISNRIKELSISYANDILNDNDKKIIEEESFSLLKEINSIIKNTSFNNKSIFNSHDIYINDFCIKNLNFDIDIRENNIYIKDFLHDNKEKTFVLDDFNIKNVIKKYDIQNNQLYEIDFNKINNIDYCCNINNDENNYLCINLKNIFEDKDKIILNGKGNIYINNKYNNIDVVCELNKRNKETTINFLVNGNTGKAGKVFIKDIDNIDQLKNLNKIKVFVDNKTSEYTLSNSKTTFCYEQKNININNLYENMHSNNNALKVSAINLNRDNIDFNFKDKQIVITENISEKKWQETYIEKFLNENMIDKYIKNPISNYISYLGIKENELIRKMDLNEVQNNIIGDYLNKISDTDMAKEMLQLTKNEMLLNVNNFLFKNNLNKDRMYIQSLLN